MQWKNKNTVCNDIWTGWLKDFIWYCIIIVQVQVKLYSISKGRASIGLQSVLRHCGFPGKNALLHTLNSYRA